MVFLENQPISVPRSTSMLAYYIVYTLYKREGKGEKEAAVGTPEESQKLFPLDMRAEVVVGDFFNKRVGRGRNKYLARAAADIESLLYVGICPMLVNYSRWN